MPCRGFLSGQGGADEDRRHVQHRLQEQPHTGSDAGGRHLGCGALHHRTAGGGETSPGGDGGRQRHDGRRPHPETPAGGGESLLMMKMSWRYNQGRMLPGASKVYPLSHPLYSRF